MLLLWSSGCAWLHVHGRVHCHVDTVGVRTMVTDWDLGSQVVLPVLIALAAKEAGGNGLVQGSELIGGGTFHNPVHLHKSGACWLLSGSGCPAVVGH